MSGKMQLDRQDTTLVTPISWAVCKTLSLILMLSLCSEDGPCETVTVCVVIVESGESHQEVQVLPHVQEKPSHFGRQVDDVSGTMLLKNRPGLSEISVYGTRRHT